MSAITQYMELIYIK